MKHGGNASVASAAQAAKHVAAKHVAAKHVAAKHATAYKEHGMNEPIDVPQSVIDAFHLIKDFPNRLTIEKINKISVLDKHRQTCDGASSPVGQTTATLQNQPGPFFKKNLKNSLTSIDKNGIRLTIFFSKFTPFF